MSLTGSAMHFNCCLSQCPCQTQICSTIWQPDTWTSHHCSPLPCTVHRYLMLTLLVPAKSVHLLRLPSHTSFPSGSPCWTATAVFLLYICLEPHDCENYSPLSYISTASEISVSSESSLMTCTLFFDPPLYQVSLPPTVQLSCLR
jgi:hypothetical protein